MRAMFGNATRVAACLAVLALMAAGAVLRAAEPAPPAASPAAAMSPSDVVKDTVDKVTKILTDPGYKDADKRAALREQIRQTILKVVDMEKVGSLTLATYRKKFDDAEFRRFCDLFSRLVFTTYISHMEKYNGQKIGIQSTENVDEDRVLVHTKTFDETGDIPVDYSLYRVNGAWRLYDVHIEGVSLVKNYRSQFGEILTNKKPSQLNDQIETKVKENEAHLQKGEAPAADLQAPKQGGAK